jgi:hypothetical protein
MTGSVVYIYCVFIVFVIAILGFLLAIFLYRGFRVCVNKLDGTKICF